MCPGSALPEDSNLHTLAEAKSQPNHTPTAKNCALHLTVDKQGRWRHHRRSGPVAWVPGASQEPP